MSTDAATRITQARKAQKQWGCLSPKQRAKALRPLRHQIAQRIDEIIEIISGELAKPPMDVLTGDIMVTLEHLRFYERFAAQALRPRGVGRVPFFFRNTRFDQVFEPHGVVLVCAPWNYPLQLSIVPAATALFAGNAVLLKCSEHTPRTTRLIADLFEAAALPADLVQVCCDIPAEASALLEACPDFIFFTGSNGNGRVVAAKGAALMVPTAMELGGKDPALVFDSCDLPRAVNGLVYGAFSNSGQVCVATRRIYVQLPIYDEFLRLFLERTSQLRVGTTIESDRGPIQIERICKRISDQVGDALARGATLHTPADQDGPVVLTGVPADASFLQEESFGPIVCIAPFSTEFDAVARANSSAFALSASIWTNEKTQARRVGCALRCGSVAINDVIRNIGNPYSAFGGNNASGYGRYHGIEGLHTFSRVKSIMTLTRARPAEVHWFPFTAATFGRLRKLLQLRHANGLLNKLKALTGGRS